MEFSSDTYLGLLKLILWWIQKSLCNKDLGRCLQKPLDLIKRGLLKSKQPSAKQPGTWQFSRGKWIIIASGFHLWTVFASSWSCITKLGNSLPENPACRQVCQRSFWQNCENCKTSEVYLVIKIMHTDSFLFYKPIENWTFASICHEIKLFREDYVL